MIPWKPSPTLLLPLLLAFGESAQALQIVDAQDGQSALAQISRKEVTRIAFERGRVRRVTGNAGEFVLEKDEERGQIFVRPSDAQSNKPINLFLSSEHATVALLLQPLDAPADSILIRERPNARESTPTRLEASAHHVRSLKNLLLALAQDALPQDMQARERAQELELWPLTHLTLQRSLLGARVVGEKYLLTNTGTAVLQLSESRFYKPGVMAVSLESSSLNPGQSSNLFVLRERRGDD